MNRTALFAATLIAGALVTAGASAQTFKKYATEGDWEIAVNASCVAIQRFKEPTSQVQMGTFEEVNSPMLTRTEILVQRALLGGKR